MVYTVLILSVFDLTTSKAEEVVLWYNRLNDTVGNNTLGAPLPIWIFTNDLESSRGWATAPMSDLGAAPGSIVDSRPLQPFDE